VFDSISEESLEIPVEMSVCQHLKQGSVPCDRPSLVFMPAHVLQGNDSEKSRGQELEDDLWQSIGTDKSKKSAECSVRGKIKRKRSKRVIQESEDDLRRVVIPISPRNQLNAASEVRLSRNVPRESFKSQRKKAVHVYE